MAGPVSVELGKVLLPIDCRLFAFRYICSKTKINFGSSGSRGFVLLYAVKADSQFSRDDFAETCREFEES
jgi:hypothetical protein